MVNEYVSKMCRCVGEELDKVGPLFFNLYFGRVPKRQPHTSVFLEQRTLRKIVLVIKEDGAAEIPFERFVFDVEWLVHDDMLGKDGRDSMSVPPHGPDRIKSSQN